MTSLMQQALGKDWERLPPSLQAHYLAGDSLDIGQMDVEFPWFMSPVLLLLSHLGALVRRRGRAVATRVDKRMVDGRQQWRRTLCYADGHTLRFDSVWELGPNGQVVEFVNPWLGLQMQPFVVGQQLHYRGVHFVLQLGRRRLAIAPWVALGTATIVEHAIDERHFAMDFRMVHPIFGQLFRYAGRFRANAGGGGAGCRGEA